MFVDRAFAAVRQMLEDKLQGSAQSDYCMKQKQHVSTELVAAFCRFDKLDQTDVWKVKLNHDGVLPCPGGRIRPCNTCDAQCDLHAGLSVGDVQAILQLASTALIWHQKSDVFLSNHFPWQLCLRLLAEVLQLSIRSDPNWGGSTAQVQFATDASLADATSEAVSLVASLTTSCIHAVKYVRGTDTDFAGLEDCCNWLLALLESCLETHVTKPWSGVIVMLLAAFHCHLNEDIEVKLARGSDFDTSVEAGECNTHDVQRDDS